MAVAPTGAIYKALKFDNVSSRTYGVYITGEAVYNAPKRDVEMIKIPGRNGSFALDKGRFENIEVSYPAGIFADTEADFRQAISDFRNFLCSRKGYVRLQDEYNPDEYRMAVYKSGLEVDPAMLKAGEFKITFECKPQRWLTSGETATAVASGGTVTNPTLFEAGPLLVAQGNGTIVMGGNEIRIDTADLGQLLLSNGGGHTPLSTMSYPLDEGNIELLETGDAITIGAGTYFFQGISMKDSSNTLVSMTATISGPVACSALPQTTPSSDAGKYQMYKFLIDAPLIFNKGTNSTATFTISFSVTYKVSGTTYTYSGTNTVSCQYIASSETIVAALYRSSSFSPSLPSALLVRDGAPSIYLPQITGYSTAQTYSGDIYIDLDIGEAYGITNGNISNLNNIVTIPADLPTLAPGSNTITYDNTITSFKITPRWWKV